MENFEERLGQYSNGPQPSDDLGEATVSVESISGKYLELERQGKLADLVKLQKKREQLCFDLLTVEAELSQINNPLWLLNYFVEKKGKQFAQKLKSRAERLERGKKTTREKIAEVEDQIRKIEPLILEISPPLPIAQTDKSTLTAPFLRADDYFDARVFLRDFVIQRIAQKEDSNENICIAMDGELGIRGGPPIGFPQPWLDDFGAEWSKKYPDNFYLAAYKDPRTQKRMQSMISKAKKRIR